MVFDDELKSASKCILFNKLANNIFDEQKFTRENILEFSILRLEQGRQLINKASMASNQAFEGVVTSFGKLIGAENSNDLTFNFRETNSCNFKI